MKRALVDLRQAVADQISATRGLAVSADRVVVFPGAKPPIGLCQQAYVNPGDEVIGLVPYWVSYPWSVYMAGAKFTPVPSQPDCRPDLDAMEWAVSSGRNEMELGALIQRGEGLSGNFAINCIFADVDDTSLLIHRLL